MNDVLVKISENALAGGVKVRRDYEKVELQMELKALSRRWRDSVLRKNSNRRVQNLNVECKRGVTIRPFKAYIRPVRKGEGWCIRMPKE